MTHKLRRRNSSRSSSQKFSHNKSSDKYYSDVPSRSLSPYESNRADDDQSYSESSTYNSINGDSQFSNHSPESIPETNNSNAKESSQNSSKVENFSQPITQTAPFYNIAPLPIFHGDTNECPIKHLSRFIKVCRANNVSTIEMMMRIFPVTLENEAALWYDLNVEPYSVTWEEIKLSFIQAYNKIETIDDLRSELMMINQGDEETVRSYFLRLQEILKKWPGNYRLEENLIKGKFIDGLREDLKEWVILHRPSSLNEALRLGLGFEEVKSVRRKRETKRCGICEGEHEELGCEVRERMRELWRSEKDNLEGLKKINITNGCNDDDKEVVQKLVRSVTMAARKMKEVNEDDDKKEDRENLTEDLKKKKKRESQCQCSKHQCLKNKLERNNSTNSRNSNAEQPIRAQTSTDHKNF